MSLKIEPCTFKSAKYAVEHWHYSKCMPAGKLVKLGVWEDEKFVGVVIFGRGANQYVPQSLGLKITECCELVRVALTKHETPTTRIIAIALRVLKKTNTGIKTVFSYADWTNQHHEGIIYKAGNWKQHGLRVSKGGHININGKIVHNRTLSSRYGKRENMPEVIKQAFKEQLVQEKYFFTYDLRR